MAKTRTRSTGSLAGSASALKGAHQQWRQGITLAFFGILSLTVCWAMLDQLGFIWTIPFLRGFEYLPFVLIGVGGLIGITRASRFLYVFTALVGVFWLIVSFTPMAQLLARPLIVSSPPVEADAVVVLASHIQEDNSLSDEALSRLLRGMEMCRQKYVPRIIITEMYAPQGKQRIAAEELMRALEAPCPLEVVGPIINTHDESIAVARLARERGWKRMLIVTAPMHSKRALLTFRKAASGSDLEFLSVPCEETSYDVDRLNRAGDRRYAFNHALHEIVGTWVYRFRGWI